MKRTAAIIGPTPAFVRWAINHACSLRELDADNLPYQTFRQLRSIREISLGKLQQRIVNGICFHNDYANDPETARGFPVDEVFQLSGTGEEIASCCDRCPANSVLATDHRGDLQPAWAGCYGWFRSEEGDMNLIDMFEQVSRSTGSTIFADGNPARVWFRIWQNQVWSGKQLAELNRFCSTLPSADSLSFDFQNFVRAIQACQENRLELVTELIPSGESDGNQWTIRAHCLDCQCEMADDARRCGECGRIGHPVSANRRKVLGLRPYMLLKEIIGIEQTGELLDLLRKNDAVNRKPHE